MDTINPGNRQYLSVGLQRFWISVWRILGRFSHFEDYSASRVVLPTDIDRVFLSQSLVNLAIYLPMVVLLPVLVSRYECLCAYRAALIDHGASISECFQRGVVHEVEINAHSEKPPPLLTTGVIRFTLSAQFVAAGLVPRCDGGSRSW